jgi:signal transduction histidine kinase
VGDYQQRAADKNITLLLDAPTAMFALADERRLHQVLDNLVSNAVKYSPAGRQVVVRLTDYAHREINVSNTATPSLQEPNTIRIAVHDQGPGLTEEDKTKLFGKFVRLSAQPTDGEHSSGLGLSIVKRMVEAMNGKVWCESEAGKGASFIVELPQAQLTES